jgi:hypothetical protein
MIRFRLDSALDLFVVNFDAENAKHLNETKLDSRNHTAFVPTPSDAHIALGQTFMSYGREQSCTAAQTRHSNVQSTSTKAHGEDVAVICESGFHLSNQNHGSYTCLDGKWVPPLPLCV